MDYSTAKSFAHIVFTVAVALAIACCVPIGQAQAASTTATLSFAAGWSLVGNGVNAAIDVPTTFGDAANVYSVWKWNSATSNWAFYTPTQDDGGAAYAASKSYDFLITINAGDGYWVNAKAAFATSLPAGSSFTTASFRDNSSPPNPLPMGWSLISVGDGTTPQAFNIGISAATPANGVIPNSVVTLWAWDSTASKWYLYAPRLDSLGTLTAYIANNNHLNFSNKVLSPTTGFWVNRAASAGAQGPIDRSAAFGQTLVNLANQVDQGQISDSAYIIQLSNLMSTIDGTSSGPQLFQTYLNDVVLGPSFPQARRQASRPQANRPRASGSQPSSIQTLLTNIENSTAYQGITAFIQSLISQLASSGIPEPVSTALSAADPEVARAALALDYQRQIYNVCWQSAFTSDYCMVAQQKWAAGDPGGALTAALTGAGRPLPSYLVASSSSITLAVVKAGVGSGSVSSFPLGISCGATCSSTFATGSVVTLTATPALGSTFGGWVGDCSGTGSCTITMNSSNVVGAMFGGEQWSGTYNGTYYYNCPPNNSTYQYNNESFSFAIANGFVTMPQSPAAEIGINGWVTFGSDPNIVFTGTINQATGTASGDWTQHIPGTCTGQAGDGYGTWTARRTLP